MDSFDILVIILSIALAVFLVLGIITLVLVIRILRHLKTVTEKAQHVADNIDTASEFFKKAAGPAAIGKLLANIYETIKKKEK